MNEVEDIMCDQGILTADFDMNIQTTSSKLAISATRLRLAVALLARSLLPTMVEVFYAYLRNQKTVMESVRRQILPTVFAFLANSLSRSLSSVQRGIYYPLTIRTSFVRQQSAIADILEDSPEKCVECCVLYEPSESQSVKADIIFIHGIHGSLVNTWKQGAWNSSRNDIKQTLLKRTKSINYLDEDSIKVSLKRTIVDDGFSLPSKLSKLDNDLFASENFEEENFESNEDCSYSKCWPRDWISKDYPDSRVIALNYTTDPYLWCPVWLKKRNRSGMVDRCREMIDHLLRLKVGQQPIIWVGHSKGGLYIKQIVVYAWETQVEELKNLYTQSKAIMFYSVPHKGSVLADFTLPFLRRSVELLEVQRNCQFVLKLHQKFLNLLECDIFNPEIFSFIETSLTFMSFVYLRIVTVDSADPGIGDKWGVPLDHREICKPSNKNCFLYQELVKLIENVRNKVDTLTISP